MQYRTVLFMVSVILVACSNRSAAPPETIVPDSDNTVKQRNSNATSSNNIADSNNFIIPGERIGKTFLNSDAQNLELTLGKPDISDAAMGKAWNTWYSKKSDEHPERTELNVYTTYKDSSMLEKTVQQIRITSPYFNTGSDIHVSSSFNEITTAFPGIYKAAQYKEDKGIVTIYDEEEKGIAFEIAAAGKQGICTGIIIHNKGEKVTDIYVMLHPGMLKFD